MHAPHQHLTTCSTVSSCTGRIHRRRNWRALTWSLVAALPQLGVRRSWLQSIRRQGVLDRQWRLAADVGLGGRYRSIQGPTTSRRSRLGRREDATQVGTERPGAPPLLRLSRLLHPDLFHRRPATNEQTMMSRHSLRHLITSST